MELKQGSVVIIKRIITNKTTTSSIYENLVKMVGKIGVVGESIGSSNGILYCVTFKVGEENCCFYNEELEVIGVSNSHSAFCYCCGSKTKYCIFKNINIFYCPKCLI